MQIVGQRLLYGRTFLKEFRTEGYAGSRDFCRYTAERTALSFRSAPFLCYSQGQCEFFCRPFSQGIRIQGNSYACQYSRRSEVSYYHIQMIQILIRQYNSHSHYTIIKYPTVPYFVLNIQYKERKNKSLKSQIIRVWLFLLFRYESSLKSCM